MHVSGTARRLQWTTVVSARRLVMLAARGAQAGERRARASRACSWPARCSAAVHHAEVVAHRVGEPFGSLVLAVAVTVIEVALIVTLMVRAAPTRRRSPATPCSPR